MKKTSLILAFFSLIGCGPHPNFFDGRGLTYSHEADEFEKVQADAEQRCQSIGKHAIHESTDCPALQCASVFSCMDKDAGSTASTITKPQ